MLLKYVMETSDLQEVEAKLKALSLAYKKEKISVPKQLLLIDSREKITGKEAILAHLQVLEKELPSWYYCDC